MFQLSGMQSAKFSPDGRFHLRQAIWRRVQTEGLAEAYRQRRDIFVCPDLLDPTISAGQQHKRHSSEPSGTRINTRNICPGRLCWPPLVDGAAFTPADWSVSRQEVRYKQREG